MKKIILVTALFLAGCNTSQPNLISNKFTVVMPDKSMFYCPTIDSLPKSNTLTDVEVAKTVVELYKDNKICKNSINQIQKFLKDSQAKITQP